MSSMNGDKRTVKQAAWRFVVESVNFLGTFAFLVLQFFLAYLLGFLAIVFGILSGSSGRKGGRW